MEIFFYEMEPHKIFITNLYVIASFFFFFFFVLFFSLIIEEQLTLMTYFIWNSDW